LTGLSHIKISFRWRDSSRAWEKLCRSRSAFRADIDVTHTLFGTIKIRSGYKPF